MQMGQIRSAVDLQPLPNTKSAGYTMTTTTNSKVLVTFVSTGHFVIP